MDLPTLWVSPRTLLGGASKNKFWQLWILVTLRTLHSWLITPVIRSVPEMVAATVEYTPVMAAITEQCHTSNVFPEPCHVTADFPEPLHATANKSRASMSVPKCWHHITRANQRDNVNGPLLHYSWSDPSVNSAPRNLNERARHLPSEWHTDSIRCDLFFARLMMIFYVLWFRRCLSKYWVFI